jgi:uncharacterized membrane protein
MPSLAPAATRAVLTVGTFAILSFLLMRMQSAMVGQAQHLPGLVMFAMFAVALLLLGSDVITLHQGWLSRRGSRMGPWPTVFCSLLCVIVAMVLLAGILLLMRTL